MSDELQVSRQKISVTAGIHRQTWISGYLLFVDLQLDNQSSKPVKKIELQLEKATVSYVHSAPSLGNDSADLLRLPDHMEKEIIARKAILESFDSIRPSSQDFRTVQLEIPTGLVSIETGRFFGIRYFLNVQMSCSFSKRLQIQLPITIIHPSSIDIPPNALAQVTASIEYKHRNLTSSSTNNTKPGTNSPYRYRPGQAFTAAREQSIQELRKHALLGSAEIESLTRALDASPRRLFFDKTAVEARQTKDTTTSISGSPRKMKITRRQSAAVLGGSNSISPYHHHHHRRCKSSQRASSSLDDEKGMKYRFPRSSFETTIPCAEPRVSFDEGVRKAGRSGLERSVFAHLRGGSEEEGKKESTRGGGGDGGVVGANKNIRVRTNPNKRKGPRLQRSTSGLAFDDSDKENQVPKRT